MWKQIFQIQKYDLVNWKLKWNNNPRWEINTIKNTGVFLSIFGTFKNISRNENITFLRKN